MACPEFENPQDLKRNFDEPGFDEFGFDEVDEALTKAFAGVTLSPHFQARVHARLRPVPVLPALLDLTGAISVLAVLAVLAFAFVPDVQVDFQVFLGIASVLALVSVLVAYRTVAKA